MIVNQTKNNLILDYGNTLKKIAVFNSGNVVSFKTYEKATSDTVINYIEKNKILGNAIISSVVDFPLKLKNYIEKKFNYLEFDCSTPIPLINKYSTPETLGKDRLACAVAAYNMFPKNNILIINAGSCLTYDFVNNKGEYIGGAISPGLIMRFRALYNFTKKLPLINEINEFELIGTSTEKSILSGVLNGIITETEGVIQQYKLQYTDLKVVFSGGDLVFFEKNIKSPIFAVSNLVIKGLNLILEYNVK